MIKTLVLVGLLAGNAAAAPELRGAAEVAETNEAAALDLEVVVDGGRRELFPLLPGTKCPAGHQCRARHMHAGVSPMMSALKDNLKNPLKAHLRESYSELNSNLNTAVESGDYCTRRSAMAKAAGLAAGLALATVNMPAYAAETATVLMGDDTGNLKFVPTNVKVCKGDSVKWVLNKSGPHNVVFDEEGVPAGVKAEDISMEEQIGDEGATFVQKFDVAGTYNYYCEPHRSAGMNGVLTVA